ncbi:MAG TPA: YIP1 family protein, partial [Pyrinomonadaceae bacterium]|nr:YIP1 family protein [Pyrinomonadaceae bacterium]
VIEQIEKSPQGASMGNEQKETAVNINMTIGKVVRFGMPVLFLLICVLGAACYWGGAKAFGGTGGFFHGWSVFVYSALPPALISMIANFIVLAFKDVNDINYVASQQRGVIHANPSFLFDGKASPVLTTLVSTIDLFLIWGWVLAAIGLRITNRLSSGSAWAVVIIFGLIGVLFRVVGAFFSGNPN